MFLSRKESSESLEMNRNTGFLVYTPYSWWKISSWLISSCLGLLGHDYHMNLIIKVFKYFPIKDFSEDTTHSGSLNPLFPMPRSLSSVLPGTGCLALAVLQENCSTAVSLSPPPSARGRLMTCCFGGCQWTMLSALPLPLPQPQWNCTTKESLTQQSQWVTSTCILWYCLWTISTSRKNSKSSAEIEPLMLDLLVGTKRFFSPLSVPLWIFRSGLYFLSLWGSSDFFM